MTGRIGILVIHGMGSQRPGYADDLIKSVGRRLRHRTERLVWQEIHWADSLKDREDRLWTDMTSAVTPDGRSVDLRWRRTREFIVHNFGDAIAYHRDFADGSAYRIIHDAVSSSITMLKRGLDDPDAPVVVLAHSLGAHIMSNYIWDRQRLSGDNARLERLPTLTSMITFGCSIPLFSLSFDIAEPILLPSPDLPGTAMRRRARWINLLDADDVLAWPLRPLYARSRDRLTEAQRQTVERIEDRMIDAGGILRAWNPASHMAYSTDDDLSIATADHLGELLDALDRPSADTPPAGL